MSYEHDRAGRWYKSPWNARDIMLSEDPQFLFLYMSYKFGKV